MTAIDDPELVALSWIHWHIDERVHSYLSEVPTFALKTAYEMAMSALSHR